ncbi:large conductance mechanosensitive channel protein MscL [Rhodococcus sp. X156]|uniref:large conductance mechanosensitive channel protein MscL n=1 Tax=Rhodococcus sp. X156 TaxID=2499145 RepID=UPI000FDA8F37|nr:large conductance mechanosensitive channel protein MscL [Rhodococcus sp. X156]
MLKGFKDFIMKGNVIDLSVAVVIGAAFSAIVTSFTTHLINPFIAAVGGANANGLGFQLVAGNPKTVVDVGAVITAGINFLIVAAVVYFLLVVPMHRLQERRRKGVEAGPDKPTDVALLTEIRDLLAAQQRATGGAPHSEPQTRAAAGTP